MKFSLKIIIFVLTILNIDYALSKEVFLKNKSAKTLETEKSIICDEKFPKLVRVTSGRDCLSGQWKAEAAIQ